jgi:hypothetical protein
MSAPFEPPHPVIVASAAAHPSAIALSEDGDDAEGDVRRLSMAFVLDARSGLPGDGELSTFALQKRLQKKRANFA